MDSLNRESTVWATRTLAVACLVVCSIAFAGCSPAERSNGDLVRLQLAHSGASTPSTAVDARDGTVYFSWFGKQEDGAAAVYAARLSPGDTAASAPVLVSPPGVAANAHAQAPPQIVVANDGALYVAWSTREPVEGRRFPANDLLVARSSDGGVTFEAPVFVNDDAAGAPAGHTFHDIAAGSDGSLYVSWLDTRNAETEVRVATSSDGGQTFSSGVVVAQGTCQCCRTALAEHGNSLYVAWRHLYEGEVRDIALARSDDGGRSFTPPRRVQDDGWSIAGCPHSGPSLAVDREGAVHISWYTAAEGQDGLHYAISSDRGERFKPVRRIETGIPVAQARLTRTGDEIWAAWEDPASNHVLGGRAATDDDPALRFDGSSPAVGSSSTVRSLVWQNGGSIEAVVRRDL